MDEIKQRLINKFKTLADRANLNNPTAIKKANDTIEKYMKNYNDFNGEQPLLIKDDNGRYTVITKKDLEKKKNNKIIIKN